MHYKALLIEILRTYGHLPYFRVVVFSEDARRTASFPSSGRRANMHSVSKHRGWANWTDLRSSTEWNRQPTCPHDP